MGPAWAQAHLTGDLWLPLLCLLLSQVCCSHDLPGWRFTSSEVVIPRKVSHRAVGAGLHSQLSYKIQLRGRRYVVHMKVKKSLLPRHFPVITDNDQGAVQEDYPFVPRDCYYYSYLEGVPGSRGTLDTCYGGLRGMLQVDDFTYEIKPLEASSKFEHVVSLLVSEERSAGGGSCKVEGEGTDQAYGEAGLAVAPRAGPVYLWWPHQKYLKVHYTVSNSLYKIRPNTTEVIERIVMLNSIVHTIYHHNRLEVHIRVLCIWEKRDMMDITREKTDSRVAEKFGLWKWLKVYPQIFHDTSVLLTGHKAAGALCYAFHKGACNPNWGVSYVYAANFHIFLAATITAHALGHNLGLRHDRPGCKCFRRTFCVMVHEPGVNDMLSNCSYGELHQYLDETGPCLTIRSNPYQNFPYVAPRCGDRIINQREECDCGSLKDCAEDKCCETNCSLSIGNKCSEGGCCVNCQYAPPGWICRDMLGICDLPEYCDGQTPVCPNDCYIQDGTPCSPLAVCVSGNCTDRDMQCQALFGYKIKDGSPACYNKLNPVGDRFGNCGLKIGRRGAVPVKCELGDVFCGMLHCSNVQSVPGGGEHTTFHHIIVEGVHQEKCFGFDAHFGSEVPDFGLVVDGATCGPGKYCFRQNCTFYQDMGFTCDVKTCSFRGVCNNKKNCHCLQGRSPPFCKEGGSGGSIDSGPPPGRQLRILGKVIVNINYALALMFSRAVLLLLSLIIGGFSRLATGSEQ
ncbi:disintegrin and metalloproteinase domain-containing protein 20-like [Hipposideros larvatus]